MKIIVAEHSNGMVMFGKSQFIFSNTFNSPKSQHVLVIVDRFLSSKCSPAKLVNGFDSQLGHTREFKNFICSFSCLTCSIKEMRRIKAVGAIRGSKKVKISPNPYAMRYIRNHGYKKRN